MAWWALVRPVCQVHSMNWQGQSPLGMNISEEGLALGGSVNENAANINVELADISGTNTRPTVDSRKAHKQKPAGKQFIIIGNFYEGNPICCVAPTQNMACRTPPHTPVAGPTQSFIDTATRLTLHISDSEDAAWRSGLQYGQPTLEADLSATWDCKHWSAIDRTVNQISDLSDEDFAKENWAAKMFCNTQAAVTRVICPTFSEKLRRLQGLWPLHSGGAKKYHSRFAAFKITILGACTSQPTI